jgi:uncharacterized protein
LRNVSKDLVKRKLWILLFAEAILSFSAESRDQVDEIVNKSLSSGGKSFSEPQEHGFMYIWGFQDLDGHLWKVAYMDESAINQE